MDRRHARLSIFALTLVAIVCGVAKSDADERRRPSVGAAREPHRALPAGAEDHGAQLVDVHFDAVWAAAGLKPAPRIDDATFLRRASLALNGVPPAVDEIDPFLRNTDPAKHQKKVGELLTRSRFADYWGFRLRHWVTDMRDIPGQSTNVGMLYFYARQAMAENRGWDRIARDFLATDGDITQHGFANFAMYFDCEANEMADAAGRLFMGVNLACAQCHDDPHHREWTQDTYWGLAAYFARLKIIGPAGNPEGEYEKRFPFLGLPDTAVTTLPGGDSAVDGHWGDIRAVVARNEGEVKLPDPKVEKVMLPTPLGAHPITNIEAKPRSRTRHFVDWLVSPDNPYFARAAVNRVWHELYGRGFVDRPDGFTPGAEVLHQRLLGQLSLEFARRQHDLKWLMRTIVLSRVFQQPSVTRQDEESRARDTWHLAPARRLNGDQWHDSILRAAGDESRLYRMAAELRPLLDEERRARLDRHGESAQSDGEEVGEELTDAQRQKLDGLRKSYNGVGNELMKTRQRAREGMSPTNESLMQMNGRLIARALDYGDAVAEIAGLPTPEARLERAYQRCLARSPTPDETRTLLDALSEGSVEAARDVLWALLQTTEFQTY